MRTINIRKKKKNNGYHGDNNIFYIFEHVDNMPIKKNIKRMDKRGKERREKKSVNPKR